MITCIKIEKVNKDTVRFIYSDGTIEDYDKKDLPLINLNSEDEEEYDLDGL